MTNAYLFLEGFVKACFLSFVILDCHASPPPVPPGKQEKRTRGGASFLLRAFVPDFLFLRHQENLAGVRIFYFSSGRVSFNVNFSSIGRIGTVNTTRLPWNFGGGRIVLWRSRGPCRVRNIANFRCRGRGSNRDRNRCWGRRRKRPRRRSRQIAVLALLGLGIRFAARK